MFIFPETLHFIEQPRENAMKPKKSAASPQRELFRVELSFLVDAEHPLVKLGGKIDWTRFEELLGATYHATQESRIRDGLNTIEISPGFFLPRRRFGNRRRHPIRAFSSLPRPCAPPASKFPPSNAIRSITS